MTDPRTLLVVALGAAFGGLCRYLVGVYFVGRFGPGFPFGTLFINLTASFFIGVVVELAQTRALGVGPLARVALTAGFLGGYSTFSSFAYETLIVGGEGQWALSALYGFGSVIAGVTACWLGMIVTRLLTQSV